MMLDTACILFSTILCVFVTFRAIMLDGKLPWFRPLRSDPPPPVDTRWKPTAARSQNKG
jgi:hypothetical protein